MCALDPEVEGASWAAISPLIPPPGRTHSLGSHRPRVSDRDCFDSGHGSNVNREPLTESNIDDAVIAKKRKHGAGAPKRNQPMEMRWPVKRSNSWLSNYGHLRSNTDHKTIHRLARLSLAVVFIITAKLID